MSDGAENSKRRPPHAGKGRPLGSKNKYTKAMALVAREALTELGGAQVFVNLFNNTADDALKFRIAQFLYEQSHGRAAEQASPDDPDRAVKIVCNLPRNSSVTVQRSDGHNDPSVQ